MPARVTCITRKREMPLSEMNLTSIQTNPHHIHLWACRVCAIVLQAYLYRPEFFDNQNTVVVVATTVMSCAALGATLVLTPARSLPTPFSAFHNCYSD
jgi:hypothetical protein